MAARRSRVPRYSLAEDAASSAIHAVGVALGLGGLVLLVMVASQRGTAAHVVSCAVYGASLVSLFAASTLYHAVRAPAAKRVLRVLDHCAIYLLIAGTYTPLSLMVLGGRRGWMLVGAVWSLAVVGILLKAIDMERFKVVGGVLYLAMGWLVVVAGRPLLEALDTTALVLIVLGGLTYTFGMAIYGLRRLPYNHALWHAMVLAASALHFFAVLGCLPAPLSS
jgi:hemolysin III